ncbi:heme exporter protein CcmD [Marivibrio halodurans]|uniref:Heme exporter protein D n=1 Tax=Marivibrio halodurans TaxID=2039722 RepID=A0A8J7SP26_9PROT|nr:heme exporter protein CcmD [Marivibrio halodurans]MBP5858066.1 heme exporter protein CcmD [Marivibrio halodurans]
MGIGALFTAEFWAMGGHGFFVWSAYGFCFAVLAALALGAWRMTARAERELAALDPERAARRRNG